MAHVRDVYVACVAGARAELFEGGAEQARRLLPRLLPLASIRPTVWPAC